MRPFVNRQNAQKKAYYTDRFLIQPSLERKKVSTDTVFEADVKSLKEKVKVNDVYIEAGQLVVWVEPKENLKAMKAMKVLGYENLSELSAVDFIAQKQGFEVFYQMLSMQKHRRARIKCFLPQGEQLASVESVYKSANWAEREMYDMFGIVLKGHPYMKRILMPDDWQGHPLLKTYPLQGDEAAQWYEIDTLFGKEYREVVGPEQRDPARIEVENTIDFAHIRHEVQKGAPFSKTPTTQEYQEKDGVNFVTKASKDKSKTLKERY
ncbi:MAG: NADH-quinone oxidoreductase subunit C [Campylobacteraceae bacterium]|nr:NADH-quinone oxidoreductase subunit C [Campylobacteraceae bacterium]